MSIHASHDLASWNEWPARRGREQAEAAEREQAHQQAAAEAQAARELAQQAARERSTIGVRRTRQERPTVVPQRLTVNGKQYDTASLARRRNEEQR